MSNIYENDAEYRALIDFYTNIDDERPSFTRFLDFTINSPDFEHPRIIFEMRDNLVGNLIYRTLHGGVIASMLDAVGGHAVFLSVPKQVKGQPMEKQVKRVSKIGSIDLRIDYLRAGKGKSFTATAAILRTGNKVAVTRMELLNDDQKLIAVGTGSYTVG